MDELKPCPFCGSSAIEIYDNFFEDDDGWTEKDWIIQCHGCGSAFIAIKYLYMYYRSW